MKKNKFKYHLIIKWHGPKKQIKTNKNITIH